MDTPKRTRKLTVDVREGEETIDFLDWCEAYARLVVKACRASEHRPAGAA